MKFVFHVGIEDIFNIVVSVVIIAAILVIVLLFCIEKIRMKFSKWRSKRKEEKSKRGDKNNE